MFFFLDDTDLAKGNHIIYYSRLRYLTLITFHKVASICTDAMFPDRLYVELTSSVNM